MHNFGSIKKRQSFLTQFRSGKKNNKPRSMYKILQGFCGTEIQAQSNFLGERNSRCVPPLHSSLIILSMEIFPTVFRRCFELFSAQNTLCSESRLDLVGRGNRMLQAGTKTPRNTRTTSRHFQPRRAYQRNSRPCRLLLSFTGRILLNSAA